MVMDGSTPGPFFNLYQQEVANPCTQGFQSGAPNVNKSGIIFFPGSVGLYRNGVLVGGLGVSSDGVDQDDFVTSAGAAGFEAPAQIRADELSIQNVRLPYSVPWALAREDLRFGFFAACSDIAATASAYSISLKGFASL